MTPKFARKLINTLVSVFTAVFSMAEIRVMYTQHKSHDIHKPDCVYCELEARHQEQLDAEYGEQERVVIVSRQELN